MPYYLSAEHPPVHAIYDAHLDARRNIPPSFSTKALLGRMGLEGDKPDGRAFMDRLIDDSRSVNVLRKAIAMNRASGKLLDLTNQYTANAAQELLAQRLGSAISRHVEREQSACPQVLHLALTSHRPDIISREAYDIARAIKLDQIGEMITPTGEELLVADDVLAMDLSELEDRVAAAQQPNVCQRLYC